MIDTNVLIDDMLDDAERHAKAKEGLDAIDVAIVPTTVIEELVWVLTSLKVDNGVILRKVKEILDSDEIISVDGGSIKEAIRLLTAESASCRRFNDKLILAIAKERAAQLFTFDAELRKECRANGVKLLYE